MVCDSNGLQQQREFPFLVILVWVLGVHDWKIQAFGCACGGQVDRSEPGQWIVRLKMAASLQLCSNHSSMLRCGCISSTSIDDPTEQDGFEMFNSANS